jgi:CubicO group peptidase (beta-lactamase class C family)
MKTAKFRTPAHAVLRLTSLLIILCFCLTALGQIPKETKPRPATEEKAKTTPPTPSAQLTPADVEAFLDGLVPAQLERENIAGAVVAVVKDGQVIFEKGYGYSDVKSRKPVSPTDTLFRPGSVSKLFTWTAVMQLVEQGKLDLDRDVNDYLDYKIPPAFGKPITLRNLMTHTPGFSEGVRDMFADKGGQYATMNTFMPTHIPQRIFPPGTVPAYSNYGAALAGYIVQRVSGMPFEQYLEENIFKPLQMQHSTFVQPLPKELQPLMSSGYKLGSDDKAKDFEIIGGESPAGALSASADDMTHFMIAHLQNGKYGSAQILSPNTAILMHSRQRTDNEALNGMALGFYEESRNGHRIIGHGGDTLWFHSDLHLIPDSNVGFFISYNSQGKGEIDARGVLWHQFLDRYFPWQPQDPPKLASAKDDAKLVAGSYITSRGCDTCIVHLMSMIGQETFAVDKDGNLVSGEMKHPNGQPKHFEEIAPLVFREVNGKDLIAFNRNGLRGIEFVPNEDIVAAFKAPWYKSKNFFLFLLVMPMVIFALTLALWPVAALVRRHYKQKLPIEGTERKLHLVVRLVCALDIIVVALWTAWLMAGLNNLQYFGTAFNGKLHALQVLTLISVIASVIPLWAMIRAWTRQGAWWWSRVFNTVVVVACVAYIWFVLASHLLDFSLRY